MVQMTLFTGGATICHTTCCCPPHHPFRIFGGLVSVPLPYQRQPFTLLFNAIRKLQRINPGQILDASTGTANGDHP